MIQSSTWKPFINTALVYVLRETEIHVRAKNAAAVLTSDSPFVSERSISRLSMLSNVICNGQDEELHILSHNLNDGLTKRQRQGSQGSEERRDGKKENLREGGSTRERQETRLRNSGEGDLELSDMKGGHRHRATIGAMIIACHGLIDGRTRTRDSREGV